MAPATHKLIITGTGRAGTTFLVRLLTELGLDTGFTADNWRRSYDEHCQAGLEHALEDPSAPYIVKNPSLCAELPSLLARFPHLVIDHALIPIRELDAASRSRVRVGGAGGELPGGLWLTDDPARQKAILAEGFHGLMHTLARHDIPHTLLEFPRFATDADYTHRRLAFLLGDVTHEEFLAAFARVADPRLIHDFSQVCGAGTADAGLAAQYRARQDERARASRQVRRRRRLRRAVNALVVLAAGALAFLASRNYFL